MKPSRTRRTATVTARPHPVLLLAAASLTAFSLAGVGVLAGWLPGPGKRIDAPESVISAPARPPAVASRNALPAYRSGEVQKAPAAPVAVGSAPTATTPTEVNSGRPAAPITTAAPQPAAVSPAPTFPVAQHEPAYRVATSLPPACDECGVVESVREITVEHDASGGGALAGGLLGGLLANQIGTGLTRGVVTVLGAAGGAYAGNHIEKSMRKTVRHEVLVRFDDGSTRTFSSDTPPAWRSGDRVRLQNGLLTMGGGRSYGNPETI